MTILAAARDAFQRGFTPIPVVAKEKRPAISQWTKLTFDTADEIEEWFTDWEQQGYTNLGVLLGDPSGGLVDVDIDHPKASRLRDYFLPPTPARSGRAGRRHSHYWYVCQEGTLPGSSKRYLMPRDEEGRTGAVSVELRASLGQSVLPPSQHPSGEEYLWENDPWGGEQGPAEIDGKLLGARVSMLALATVLLDSWPKQGQRHEAYLALAGGLLRLGDEVHPFWGYRANAAEQLIQALADASNDEDGADARVRESVHSTERAIRQGQRVQGFGTLAGILGQETVNQIKVLMAEVESAAGFVSRQIASVESYEHTLDSPRVEIEQGEVRDSGEDAESSETGTRDPLGERMSTWQAVDLEPYLTGRVEPVEPTVLTRDDGNSLMYPGRVNMLYGSSESGKSWIALWIAWQMMTTGQRTVYLDLEDEPVNTLGRMATLQGSPDDVRKFFAYVRPEDAHADLQRDSQGRESPTQAGMANRDIFERTIEDVDPTLIVADGMTVLYGLHGLNPNHSSDTDAVTGWLKRLTRNGRTTVVIIDHTVKNTERGMPPIGSQHKTAMVQGTLLQAWTRKQPTPGDTGEVELIVTKDRPGLVRTNSVADHDSVPIAGLFRMDSRTEGRTDVRLAPPETPPANEVGVDMRNSQDAERKTLHRQQEDLVLEVFEGEIGSLVNRQTIHESVPSLSEKPLNQALKRLVRAGWLEQLNEQGETHSRGNYFRLQVGDG